jgi:hypothetical protein
LALCWSMHTGILLNQLQPIVLKKHGRRAKSLFRLGFDYIRQIVLNSSPSNNDDFRLSLQFFPVLRSYSTYIGKNTRFTTPYTLTASGSISRSFWE